MQIFTHKTRQMMEPSPEVVAVDATGNQYTTPQAWSVKLGGLAHLQVLQGVFVYDVRLSGASTAGAATIELKHGSTVVASKALDLTSAETFKGTIDVDLTGINGAAELVANLNVTAAADASTTAQVFAGIDLTGPLIVSGC